MSDTFRFGFEEDEGEGEDHPPPQRRADADGVADALGGRDATGVVEVVVDGTARILKVTLNARWREVVDVRPT